MPQEMTAAQYLDRLEQAKNNAEKWSRIDAVVAYITCGVAACTCLFYYANTFVK